MQEPSSIHQSPPSTQFLFPFHVNNESSIFSHVALTITRVAAHSARLLTSRVIWFPPFPSSSAPLLTSNILACFRAQRKAPPWEWQAYHASERTNERPTQKKHHRISHLPNQLEMIHLVIIVRESQPVSPNFNHSKQSRISTIASLFLLLLIRHPLFSASYWQVYQLPYNDSRMSNSHQGPPRQYQVFIPTFLWQKLSGGSEADPFDTRISQFFSIFWYKLHRQTDRHDDWGQ